MLDYFWLTTTGFGVAATAAGSSVLAPSDLTATVDTSNMNLAWTNNQDQPPADSIKIEQSYGGGAFEQIHSAAGGETTYVVTGVDIGVEYRFRVRAELGGQYSNYSNIASATRES